MKKYVWKTQNSRYCYVDANTGDDINGDGTMQNPFRSLGRATRGTTKKNFVCRGVFSEDLADAWVKSTDRFVNADYLGAAYFDGKDEFIILFPAQDMIIRNCCEITYGLNLGSLDSYTTAGVRGYVTAQRATLAPSFVFNSPHAQSNFFKRGSDINGHSMVISPKKSSISTNKFGWNDVAESYNDKNNFNTFYNIPIDKRQMSLKHKANVVSHIFSKVDLYINDLQYFINSLFDRDCNWYYQDSRKVDHKIELGDSYGEERLNLILAAMDEWNVPEASRPTFTDCIFSNQDAYELFNDPDNYDFTLKLTSDAVLPNGGYIGAMPPAIHVPILSDSTGRAETWDETTACGVVSIQNNEICYDPTLEEKRGEILSKVLTLDTSKLSLSAIYAICFNNWAAQNIAISEEAYLGDTYTTADALPIGKYVVRGNGVIYTNSNYYNGDIVTVSEDGTTFAVEEGQSATLQAVIEPNIENVCYVRTAPTAYAYIKASEGMQRGGTYLNNGNKNIVYRGRTIVPKESFVAVNDTDTFSCDGDADYKIAIIFDDTRVPSQEWFSSLLFGESFVWKNKGVVKVDAEGNSISSGNPLSYANKANGGYSDLLTKTPINQQYVQFRISVSKL